MCGESSTDWKFWANRTSDMSWKITKDGKHIAFYACFNDCLDKTSWCNKHCYMKRLPPKLERPKSNAFGYYRLSDFDVNDSESNKRLLKKIDREISYMTFFASGTIYDAFHMSCPKKSTGDMISALSEFFKTKRTRFFIRSDPYLDKRPKNAIVILSVDCKTSVDVIDWGLASPIVSHLAVIDHEDNRMTLKYLSDKLPILDCKICKEEDYNCFVPMKTKKIILMQYFGRQALAEGRDDGT